MVILLDKIVSTLVCQRIDIIGRYIIDERPRIYIQVDIPERLISREVLVGYRSILFNNFYIFGGSE